jgi:hypothetical protein
MATERVSSGLPLSAAMSLRKAHALSVMYNHTLDNLE